MVGYTQMLSRSMPKAPPPTSPEASLATTPSEPTADQERIITQLSALEDVLLIHSDTIQLEIGKETASIRRAVLKEFEDLESGEPLEFGGQVPVLALQIDGSPLTGELIESKASSARWNATDKHGNSYYISMSIDDDNSLLHIELEKLSSSVTSINYLPIEILNGWSRGDELGNRYNPLEVILLTQKNRPWQLTYLTYYGTQKSSRNVPRGTSLVTLSDRYFCQSVKTDPADTRVALAPSPDGSIATRTSIRVPIGPDGRARFSTEAYLGTRDYFDLKRAGFNHAFSLGFIGRIGITLLVVLNWIAGITHNYGAAIVVFSMLVTGALAPFTLMSMKSMKKMQELKPQMDRIMAKQKSNPQKANMEMMALYKEHKVSPLSGCLPMLLQFPVLIALFRSISHFVELRGQGFLWIKDLSLPDRLIELPVGLPLLGNYINALPIIMMLAMLFQMKMSQKQMPASQANPMAKIMSGPAMAILFGVMFYQFPSGLVLYWLTNSLMTLVWYRVARA